MVGNKLQTTVNAFREFVHSQGWSIIAEKELMYGYQLVVTDGSAKTPVDLFTTGKVLVQGKPSGLQAAIKTWVYKPQLPAATPDKITGIARIGSDESGKGDY